MWNGEEPNLFERWVKDGLSEWVFENEPYLRMDVRMIMYVIDEHLKERYAPRDR